MSSPFFRHFALIPVLFLGLSLVADSPALAQSDADLRRDNEQLRARTQELEKELDAARAKMKELEDRVTQLQRELGLARRAASQQPTTEAPPPEEVVTVDESQPASTPRALHRTLLTSYEEAVTDLPMGARPGDRERVTYMRAVQRWEPVVERELRGPVEWYVRVVDASGQDINRARERIVTFVAVDPKTDVRLGDPFDAVLNRALTARLAELEQRNGGELPVLLLKGTLEVNVMIDEQREERGSFDNPRFIGPFAAYAYTVRPTSITLPPADTEEVAPAEAPKPNATKPAPAQPTAPEKP